MICRLITICLLVLFQWNTTVACGQTRPSKPNQPGSPPEKPLSAPPSLETSDVAAIRASLQKIEQSLGGRVIGADLEKISTTIAAIDKRTESIEPPQSFFSKFVENYLSNLFWEFFGFKRSGNNPTAKAVSLIGLLVSCIKFFHYLAARRKKAAHDSPGAQTWEIFSAAYFVVVALLLSFLAFSGSAVAEQTAPVRQAQELDQKLQRLDGQLAAMRNTDVATLEQTLQRLSTDLATLRVVDSSALASSLAEIQKQLASQNAELQATDSRAASFRVQLFELLLLLITAAAAISLVIQIQKN